MRRLLSAASGEFKRAGYSGATTAAIARAADVTEAQLFRYFASKAELFKAAVFEPLNKGFAEFNATQLARDSEDPRDRDVKIRDYIEELQAFIADNADLLMTLVVAEASAPESVKGLGDVNALGEYFQIGAAVMQRRLGDEAKVPPELMVRVSFVAVLANVLFRHWIFPPGIANDREFSTALTDFVNEGVSINAG